MKLFRRKETFAESIIGRKPRNDRADVLLVYPIWVEMGGRGKLQRMLPPLGILSIASFLEQHGYEVQVVDLHAEQLSPDDFRKILQTLRPRFVGITVLSPHVVPANYIAWLAKKEVPDTKVIVGGVHAEAEPEQMLRNPAIDAVCRGDGEETMLEFVREIPYPKILGLSFRNGGRVEHTPPRPLEPDLDKFPFPAYHLINFDHYFPPVASYRNLPAMNVLMTRGCPGQCTFCNSAMTMLRSRSVESMVELIKLLRYRHGIRQIYFYDDTFTAIPQVARRFCEKMIAERVDVKWICYVRGDMFRETIAELMSRAGCHQVLIGLESGSEKLMQEIGKPIKKETYRAVVDIAHKYGIEVRGAFIVGHLSETRETMEETLQFAKDINLDFFQANILTPYPGTLLYREAKAKGLLIHERFERYGFNEVILKPANIPPDDVVRFEKYAYFRFFFRPRAVYVQLRRLTNWNQVKDLFKVLYVMGIEGYTTHKARRKYLLSWLDFDVEKLNLKEVSAPKTPRVTYEVRQKSMSG